MRGTPSLLVQVPAEDLDLVVGSVAAALDSIRTNFTWTGPFPEGGGTVYGVMPAVTLPDREHTITLAVEDDYGETDTDQFVVTIEDTTDPGINSASTSPDTLWPPNHKLMHVAVTVNATDACGGVSCKIISVSSNEPVNGTGDGNTSPDWLITGDLTLELRAERSGNGSGRVYTITIECQDESGNTSQTSTTVTVPKSRGRS